MPAARAPAPRTAVRDAQKAGHAYVVVDGTLIPIDRLAADRPFYSGRHQKHGMNLQVITSPSGDILWLSGPHPGSVHGKKAKWIGWAMDDNYRTPLIASAIEIAARNLDLPADVIFTPATEATTLLVISAPFSSRWDPPVRRTAYPTRKKAKEDIARYIELRYESYSSPFGTRVPGL